MGDASRGPLVTVTQTRGGGARDQGEQWSYREEALRIWMSSRRSRQDSLAG